MARAFLNVVYPWAPWPLEIRNAELPVVRRHGLGRHDLDQGDLRYPCRLRGAGRAGAIFVEQT